MLRLEGKEPTTENIHTYEEEKLGCSSGSTLLIELMPIPRPQVSQRSYEELIPQFAPMQEYYKTIKPRRVEYLRGLITAHILEVVSGSGKAFWHIVGRYLKSVNLCRRVSSKKRSLITHLSSSQVTLRLGRLTTGLIRF